MSSKDMEAFQRALANSKHIVAVAGAGLSAASGIPTFRGAGGLWRKFKATKLATPEAFSENPSLVWQFYHYRREVVHAASPNAAHRALAQLCIPSFRQKIALESTFTLITQNVDGLSKRALDEALSGVPETERPSSTDTEPHLIEMHGRLFEVRCTSVECGHVEWNDSSPICEKLRDTEKLVDAGAIEPKIDKSDLPKCTKCGALARPGVVWFGEEPWHLESIDRLLKKADMCLVVGTSSTVYPAAEFGSTVKTRGGKVAVFNLEHTQCDGDADFLFLGRCEEILPKALGIDNA